MSVVVLELYRRKTWVRSYAYATRRVEHVQVAEPER
jgi:hypothetical protein